MAATRRRAGAARRRTARRSDELNSSTIHATEAGRHQGWLPNELSRAIHSVEWWLCHSSTRVIVCSGYMRDEVARLFDLPTGRVDLVPNGVDGRAWQARPREVWRLATDQLPAGDRSAGQRMYPRRRIDIVAFTGLPDGPGTRRSGA